jgi:hypothetical protein
MPTPTTGIFHPTPMSAMVEAEKEAEKNNDAFTAQESAMTQAWQSNLTAHLAREEAPTTTLPASLPQSPPSPAPPHPETLANPRTSQQKLDSELHKLNTELENCQLTREALSRRETALHQRKSEIERLCTCAPQAPTSTQGQDEDKGVAGDDKDEGLYMRDVGRRSRMVVGKMDVVKSGETKKEEEKGKGVEKKPVVIARKEAKRLAMIELHRKTFGDGR